MASNQDSIKICWVIANGFVLDPTVDLHQLKEIGSFWGGWQTWRACATDNVVCHDAAKAAELIKRNFQDLCNFYVAEEHYQFLNRPSNVSLYGGQFQHDLDNREDIVALNLVSGNHDIVLLLGFDFSEVGKDLEKLQKHKRLNYQNLFKQVVTDNSDIQWVLVEHGTVAKDLQSLPNLTQDSLDSVLSMLS